MSNINFLIRLTDMFSPALRNATQISNTSANKIESNFAKINSGGVKMSASINELRSRLDALNQVRFSTTIEKEFNTATRAVNRLENQIEKLENKGKKGTGGGVFGSIVSSAAIAYGTRDILKTGIEQRQISGAINFATEGQGGSAISQAKNINNKYGLSDEAGLQGLKTITGSTRGLGYSLQQQMDIYEGVGTGVAAMGLSADAAKLSFLALGQMASKGKVSAEELRGQLGEQIPGALGIASRAMGVSQAEFSKMLDKGDIMSKDFLPKFAAQMKNEFGPAALAMATGPQAQLNIFNNKLLELKVTFAEKLLPAFMPVLTAVKNLADWFVKNSDVMIPLTIGIAALVVAANAWSIATRIASFFTGAWTVASNILNASLWTNPVTWIVAGVIALIAIIGSVIYMFDGWGKTWDNLMNFVRYSWASYKDFFSLVWLQVQDKFMTGIEFMESGWYRLKALWDEEGAAAGLSKINNQQNIRAAEIAKAKGVLETDLKAAGASLKWEIHRNDKGVGTVATDLKKKLGIGGGVSPISTFTPIEQGKQTGEGNGDTSIGKGNSDSINSGGQRSIVINIGKQIERMEVHVMNAKEGAEEIASMVREELRRTMLSINGS